MFGMPQIPYGLLGVAGGSDTRPTNTPEDMSALQKLYAATVTGNRTPAGRVARGFNQFGPQPVMPAEVDMGQPKPPPQVADPTPKPAMPPGALSPPVGPTSVGGAPLPNVGPTSLNGDPLPTASPLDTAQWPAGPASDLGPQQASGPDVIQKLMSYFGSKANPDG